MMRVAQNRYAVLRVAAKYDRNLHPENTNIPAGYHVKRKTHWPLIPAKGKRVEVISKGPITG
jgi:hypothetical protein